MQLRYLSLPLIFAYSRIQSLLCIEYYYNYASRCENIVYVWTEVLCDYLKYSHPSGTLWNAIESAKVIKIRIGTTNVHNSATRSERKKGPSVDGEVLEDVRMMSVVSDKQKQAGSSGSAPATPQGNNLPPAVPPPSISRNPLRGSKCNNLHFIPIPPLPYPLTLLLEYNIQHTLEITGTDVSCRVHW